MAASRTGCGESRSFPPGICVSCEEEQESDRLTVNLSFGKPVFYAKSSPVNSPRGVSLRGAASGDRGREHGALKGIVRRLTRAVLAGALASALLVDPAAALDNETLRYSWSLGGFFGTVARMFLPGRGEGTLTTRDGEAGTTEVELDITAPTVAGEFWRYGSAMDSSDWRTLRAWSSYRFRGRDGAKESDLGEESVIDIASGILLLRRDPPTMPRDMRIWSDGKIYPVVIQPRGTVSRRFGGRPQAVRHYAIRARKVPNERLWKGKLDIFLANDEAATPVEISVERSMARVRLLIEGQDDEG